MSEVFHIDFETFSEAELSDVGAYRYAEDSSTEVLIFAIARGDQEPCLWIAPPWRKIATHDIEADGLIAELRDDPTALVYAHNAQFERAIVMFADTPLSFLRERPKQWRCTAAMARRAAVPDSLEKCGDYLNVEAKKDTRGKALIRKFSILQTAGKLKGLRVLPSDDPVAFKEFAEYCVQDVRTEQAIHRALEPFELKGPAVLDTFLLDIQLNDRGIPVNLPALRNARAIVDDLMAEKGAQFRALTGLQPTQRDAVKGWLAAKGVVLDDMQGATLAEILPNISVGDARTAVELYSELRFAAVKKVHTMLDCANSDGRVRGTLLYHGAGTGRWSGRGMQPQNFKKPTIKNLKGAFEMLETGCTAEQLDLLYGPPLEVISSCIRNFITATLDADYASIEARILPWVADQGDALQRFRNGEDSYKVMAGVIYNKRPDAVTSDERQLGKAAILGAGYGMGAFKFQATCEQWGIPITPELAKRAIDAFRAAHPKVKQFWYDCDKAARRAVAQMGRSFSAGNYVSFQVRRVANKHFLFLRLPSGREIAYPEPRMEVDARETEERRGKDAWYDEPCENLTYYGAIPGTVIWGRVKLYGGKFAENCLSGETLILSKSRGWIRLDVLAGDLVWDGVEFVVHQGLLPRGAQEVLDVHGVSATPDHQFLSSDGSWLPAEIACHHKSVVLGYQYDPKKTLQAAPLTPVGLDRQNLRPSDRSSLGGVQRQDPVGGALPMWEDQDQSRLGADKAVAPRLRLRLLPDQKSISENQYLTRSEPSSSVPCVVLNEEAMSVAEPSGVAQLWRAQDQGMSSMVGELRELLGGHGADMAEGSGVGPDRQRIGLLSRELSLDNSEDKHPQQEELDNGGRGLRGGGVERDQTLDAALPDRTWLGCRDSVPHFSRYTKQVYDIRNCGPRHRFVVKSPTTGAVMIAHNCVQAIAADIMSYGANTALRAGYDIFTLIHDQSPATHKPGQTAPEFGKLLATLPPWAGGLPLKAEAKLCKYYAK